MVQKVSGDMLEDGAVAENPTGFTSGNYVRVAPDGTLEERTPSEVQADIGAASNTGAALTKTDDTNITATLTGNPTNGLLRAINIALGWTGLLGVARGGTGIGSYTPGNYLNASGATTLQQRTPAQVRTDLAVDTSSSGTYTPTLTNTTNISSSTASVNQWMRVGNVVTVSGRVIIDPTATGLIQLGMSIPVASDFTVVEQVGGTGASNNEFIYAYADVTNNRVTLQSIIKADVVSAQFHFSFTYLVV